MENENTLGILMDQAKNGDQAAYKDLLRACLPLIKKIVCQKINNTTLQEDVIQEVLISIHKSRHTYNVEKPFNPWLYSICRYRVADTLRTLYRKSPESISFDEIEGDSFISDKENVTNRIENSELVNKMMKTLPAKQRKIILLMKGEGLTAAEVALRLNMSISAVKVSAHRSIKTLQKKWKKENV